ncbi:MAG TPA: DUF2017 family protein [Mycobacteriales bacterium]
MARGPFQRHRDGTVGVRLPAGLRQVLLDQMRQLDQLLDTGSGQEASSDPLAELTGMTGVTGERARPDDPALLRLRPDAYAADVDGGRAAAEFRRFTEADLEALQRARVSAVLDTLAGGDRFDLDAEQAQAWVGALNDLRLAQASRLGIEDDDALERLPPTPALQLFVLLGGLLHDLLVALGAPDEF